MTSDKDTKSAPSGMKVLLNGFLAWLIAFVLYLVPGFIVAVPMGFSLGPKIKDNAEVGRLISKAVSEFYQSTLSLHYGFVLVLALLILWRSRVIARRSATRSITRGIVVSILPVLLAAIPFGLGGHILLCVLPIVLFPLAGIIGASRGIPEGSPQ